jgi:transposase
VSERTALANQVRGLLMEEGVVIAQGSQRLRRTLPEVLAAAETLAELGGEVIGELREGLLGLDRWIADDDHHGEQLAKQHEATRRLMQVEGVGPLTATAVVAPVGEGQAFPQGRQFAAWLGLVPTQPSRGGKTVLGRMTKQGNV